MCFLSCLSLGIYFENLNESDIGYTIRMSPDLEWNTGSVFPVFQDGARDDTRCTDNCAKNADHLQVAISISAAKNDHKN